MTQKKLTKAQIAALRAIHGRPSEAYHTYRHYGIRWDVYMRLIGGGYVTSIGALKVTEKGFAALELAEGVKK